MQPLLAWLASWHAELYMITGFMALVWAASEIVSTFAADPGRAMRTQGAALLLVMNVLFACLALAGVLSLAPQSATPWTALGVGLAWQTLIRTRFNVIQPLPGEGSSEGIGIPFNELYNRLQSFCRRQIDQEIVGERLRLIEQAVDRFGLDMLARRARLVLMSLVATSPGGNPDQYVQKILDSDVSEESKEMLLIVTIINYGGPAILRDMLRKDATARDPK